MFLDILPELTEGWFLLGLGIGICIHADHFLIKLAIETNMVAREAKEVPMPSHWAIAF